MRDSFPAFVRSVQLINMGFRIDENSYAGDTVYKPYKVRLTRFNQQGQKISHREWTDDGVIYDTTWYSKDGLTCFNQYKSSFDQVLTTTTYNPDGTIATIIYDANAHDDLEEQFEYNAAKQVIRRTCTSSFKTVELTEYDNDGKPIVISFMSSEGSEPELTKRWQKLLKYNTAGLCDTSIKSIFRPNNIITHDSTFYLYDTLGRIYWKKDSYSDGRKSQSVVISYDKQSRITRVFCNYTESQSYAYDEFGQWVQRRNGTDSEEWYTTYNDKGLPEKCIYIKNEETFIYTWKYQYWK